MYFKVKQDGAEKHLMVNISKTALIKDVRQIIHEKLTIEPSRQRLLYQGKELIDDHRIADYNIQLNDVVQLFVKHDSSSSSSSSIEESKHQTPSTCKQEIKCESKYYKIGDFVDIIDIEYGSWIEAVIMDIFKSTNINANDNFEEADLTFRVNIESGWHSESLDVKFDDIRPRSYYTYKRNELKSGDVVLVNYNTEDPKVRGYWYDFEISEIAEKTLVGNILVAKNETHLESCTVQFIDEVMRIETPTLLKNRESSNGKNLLTCNRCKDVKSRKCKECGCHACGAKEKPENIILCDECDYGYHIGCLTPPLDEVPSDPEWYCPSCKTDENEIVKAGDKLKFSNKKAKMPSNAEKASKRDWGHGMACVSRGKECTLVPKDHYGPIPGVEVGTCWKFRFQVSEAGVHRPSVAGIHGRESDGAYSLVLSGGYEDDIDNGEEFYYTGSGGRDLSGNKRTSEQSRNQTLTRMNKALALNCNVKLNDKTGAEAKDWKAGKPVRVVRNDKLRKHSEYAPKDGNRYDGIYKVVKYYPEKGKSGFLVWRYLLRRDDPNPAPWADGGQEFEIIYPPGYLEAQAEKEKQAAENKKKGKKRTLSDATNTPEKKKQKVVPFELDEQIEQEITDDGLNKKFWLECKESIPEGKQSFLAKVEELFMCVCCQEVVYLPITTPCSHNICKSCLKRSFSAEIYNCPCCRFELGITYKLRVNVNLAKILQSLFPGYESGR